MKKFLARFLLCGALVAVGIIVFAANTYRLVVNGVDITDDLAVELQVIDGEFVAPVTAVANALGAAVDFDNAAGELTVYWPIPGGDFFFETDEIAFTFVGFEESWGGRYDLVLRVQNRTDFTIDIMNISLAVNGEDLGVSSLGRTQRGAAAPQSNARILIGVDYVPENPHRISGSMRVFNTDDNPILDAPIVNVSFVNVALQ